MAQSEVKTSSITVKGRQFLLFNDPTWLTRFTEVTNL